MKSVHDHIVEHLRELSDEHRAQQMSRYFKTAYGEYGEGDRFFGVPVPVQRALVKPLAESASIEDIEQLFESSYHESRFCALLLLMHLYKRGNDQQREAYVRWYLDHLERVNNWDLVDCSCPSILGAFLEDRDRGLLCRLAQRDHLWTQRVAIITTLHFIRQQEYDDTFVIADLLLDHRHDLIHKAVGWMLREVGKRDTERLREFMEPRYRSMPRTMLRYAVERLPEQLRRGYLDGSI
jgi:3-methyladenine DNA glycosylase AlkD